MPSRKLAHPGSNRADRRPEPKEHRQFLDVFEDEPTTDIPPGTLAKAINAIAVGNKAKQRFGSVLWGAGTRPPAIAERTGYSAHTEGNYIVSDSGDIFSPADVSNLFGWDDGLYDEIVEYISPTRVRRRDSDVNSGTACFMQGRPNLWRWHRTQRVFVCQLGEEFYVVDYDTDVWTLVLINGYWKPANCESRFREDGDNFCLVSNSRFVYRIILNETPPRAYPINMPVIETNFASNESQGDRAHRYNYLMSVALLDGTQNFRHRLQDPPPRILTETGTTRADENRKDWSVVYADDPIGNGTDRYGQLDGAALPAASLLMSTYDGLGDATYQANINNLGYVEFSSDLRDCKTLYDVANVLQADMRGYFPNVNVDVLGEGGTTHIRVTSARQEGGAVAYFLDGTAGTSIAGTLMLRAADGGVVSSPIVGQPLALRYARLPLVPYVTGSLPQQWPNFYVIYRCADIGPTGYHLDTLGERVVNSPDFYIWNKDLRVCGSFIARRRNGYIELREGELGGEFEKADEGSVVEFEDSSRVQIIAGGFVNSKLAQYTMADAYYGDETPWMAAHIGNGRVCRVTQTGDIVSVVGGSSLLSFGGLTASDLRKPGWWPNGYRSFIRRRISATQWQVWDSIDRGETAFAVDPTYRAYTDIVNDTDLFSRASGFACINRFMREVLPSNMIGVQPDYFLFGARGQKEVRYCPANRFYRQFVGYHNREYQTKVLDDKLVGFWDFTSMFSAFCQASIHTAVTNNAVEITIPETQQKVWQIAVFEKRADVGMMDHGSIWQIGRDLVRFVTNTHEVMDFNGWDFVQGDITVDAQLGLKRWARALSRSHPIFAAIYTRVTGFVLWWVRDRRLD